MSLIGARTAAWAGAGGGISYPNQPDIAWYSAEWNNGFNSHDASTGQIIDLCGGAPFIIEDNGRLEDKYLYFSGKSATANRTITTFGTVECIFKLTRGRIVFYGATKYQTGDNTPDFYGILRPDNSGSLFEMCIPNTYDFTTWIARYSHDEIVSMARSGIAPYKNGALFESSKQSNTWGNQSVINIGGRMSTTSYNGIGEFYELRVHTAILTADQIAANYAIDRARFNLS